VVVHLLQFSGNVDLAVHVPELVGVFVVLV